MRPHSILARLIGRGLPVVALLLVALGLATAPARAQQLLDAYCTFISDNDKVASDGYRLTDAGSILRQDRANYHRFDEADYEDEGDTVFGSTSARERIPSLLQNGGNDAATLRAIVTGNPYVCVEIYRTSLYVSVEPYPEETDEQAGHDAFLPFDGVWDCDVFVLEIENGYYWAGEEGMEILEVEDAGDGQYILYFDGGYQIGLQLESDDFLYWFSPQSGDGFDCHRSVG